MSIPPGLPWVETPLLHTAPMSRRLNCEIYLKLEVLKPNLPAAVMMANFHVERNANSNHLIVAFEGEGSLAAACAADALGLRCTVFIAEDASTQTQDILRSYNATIINSCRNGHMAVVKAKKAADSDLAAILFPGDVDVSFVQGQSSLVHEIKSQLLDNRPSVIFCNVGNGTLLGGLISGCLRVGWKDVTIITLEEQGNDRFYHSMMLSKQTEVPYSLPPSMKKSYNVQFDVDFASFYDDTSATTDTLPAVLNLALKCGIAVKCVVVPSDLSFYTSLRVCEDFSFLISRACSTSLVPAYNSELFHYILSDISSGAIDSAQTVGNNNKAVFIVDGSEGTSLQEMRQLIEACKLRGSTEWEVQYEDKALQIPADKTWSEWSEARWLF